MSGSAGPTAALPAPRALLFVPGNRPERFAKALASGASGVIIDLEDAVAPADKPAARQAVADWLATRPASAADPLLLLRINSADTAWFADDLALCGAPGVAGVVCPKAEQPATLAQLRAAGARALLPLVETAAGMAQAAALAAAPGVWRLVFGAIDLQLDLGLKDANEDELLPLRMALVLASRQAGIGAPVDSVSTAIGDLTLLAEDVARARRLGFGGKLCIHPAQVAPVLAGLAPGAAELAWAQRVVEAAAGAGGAAVAVDGRMVDKPVLLRAQAILAEAG